MYSHEIRAVEKKKCFHNPSIYLSPFRRFISFFFVREKLMSRFAYTSVCPACGTLLCVPKFFVCTGLKCLYGLIAYLLELIFILIVMYVKQSVSWFAIGQLLVILLIFLLTRSISTAILAFGRWEVQQPLNDVLLRHYNDPVGHKQRTYCIIMVGIILAMSYPFGCYFTIVFGAILTIYNILIGIIAKKQKNLKAGLLIALGNSILLSCSFVWNSNVFLIVITGIGFLLCFLGMYFLLKYLDERKTTARSTGDGSVSTGDS